MDPNHRPYRQMSTRSMDPGPVTRPFSNLSSDRPYSQQSERSTSSTKRQTTAPLRLALRKPLPSASSDSLRSLGGGLNDEERHRLRPLVPVVISEEAKKLIDEANDPDWLMRTQRRLPLEIETSERELEIMRDMLEEVQSRRSDERETIEGVSRRTRDQKQIMLSCNQYGAQRLNTLRARQKQVKNWLERRGMGFKVPTEPPEDWNVADTEWREWLTGKAQSARIKSWIDSNEIGHWMNMGPVPYLFSTYAFFGGELWDKRTRVHSQLVRHNSQIIPRTSEEAFQRPSTKPF